MRAHAGCTPHRHVPFALNYVLHLVSHFNTVTLTVCACRKTPNSYVRCPHRYQRPLPKTPTCSQNPSRSDVCPSLPMMQVVAAPSQLTCCCSCGLSMWPRNPESPGQGPHPQTTFRSCSDCNVVWEPVVVSGFWLAGALQWCDHNLGGQNQMTTSPKFFSHACPLAVSTSPSPCLSPPCTVTKFETRRLLVALHVHG